MREFLLRLKLATADLASNYEALLSQIGTTTAEDDGYPPGAPSNLDGSSANGTVFLTWINPLDADLKAVEIWEKSVDVVPDPDTEPTKMIGTVVALPGLVGSYERTGVTPGQTLYYWVRAVDVTGLFSDFNDTAGEAVYVTAGTGGGGTAPAAPTSLTAQAGFQEIWLSWVNPADTDLKSVVIYENTVNNNLTATVIGEVSAIPSQIGTYTRAGLGNQVTRYYWVRAKDVDNNLSPFSSVASASTVSIDPVDLGTVVGFSSPTGLALNSALSLDEDGLQVVNVTATWTAIVDSRLSFYEVGIKENGGSEVVFATNLNRFIWYNVLSNVPYDARVRGVDRNGNRTAWSSTVSHTSATKTVDPAGAINARSTLVDPGKILISGASTLASWRNGGDLTKIEGGQIAANTVAANVVTIGLRGLDISGISFEPNRSTVGSSTSSANRIAWSAGSISYVNDSNVQTLQAITAGNVLYTGSRIYIYWVKGAGTLSSTTTAASAYGANNIVMAIYDGGSFMYVSYGRTIIDGNAIQTETITAAKIVAGTITANEIAGNTITAAKIVSGTITGTQIAANTITAAKIAAGTITATEIAAQAVTINGLDIGAAFTFDINSVFPATNVVLGAETQYLSQARTIPNSVTDVKILARVQISNPSSSGQVGAQIYVRRDGNLVDTAAFTIERTANSEISFEAYDPYPTAGSRTYAISLAVDIGSAATAVVERVTMVLSNFHKAG